MSFKIRSTLVDFIHISPMIGMLHQMMKHVITVPQNNNALGFKKQIINTSFHGRNKV